MATPNIPSKITTPFQGRPNGPTQTSKISEEASPKSPSISSSQNSPVNLPREEDPKDELVVEYAGHRVSIKDLSDDPNQFFKFLVKCSCSFESRQYTFEDAKRMAEHHVQVRFVRSLNR
jgi:hypothetical protein